MNSKLPHKKNTERSTNTHCFSWWSHNYKRFAFANILQFNLDFKVMSWIIQFEYHFTNVMFILSQFHCSLVSTFENIFDEKYWLDLPKHVCRLSFVRLTSLACLFRIKEESSAFISNSCHISALCIWNLPRHGENKILFETTLLYYLL